MMTESGYPLEWFVESIDAFLVCGICGQVLRDPRATDCGHVFCHRCVNAWIDEYGVCPSRCGEVEQDTLRRSTHIEKKISCLLTRCKYTKVGCKAILQLSDKEVHEKKCHYAKKSVSRHRSFPFFNFGSTQQQQQLEQEPAQLQYQSRSRSTSKRRLLSTVSEGEKDKRSTVRGSQVIKHRRSNSLGLGVLSKLPGLSKNTPSFTVVNQPKIPKPMRMQSQHTYRLKRTKPRESLGLVLVSGEKTPDGRPLSFYVKDVNPDTLAARAGIKPGDRIVQVDYYNLTAIAPQEAVARIKDKPLVTLTVLRGLVPPSKEQGDGLTQDHIYDEIMYADQQLSQNLSQQDDFSPFMTAGILKDPFPSSHRHRSGHLSEKDLRMRRVHSPNGGRDVRHHNYPTNGTQVTLPGEKGSKDSGLSSGSSTSPEHQRERVRPFEDNGVNYPEDAPFERIANLRQSYRTEKEMLKNFLKSKKKDSENMAQTEEVNTRKNCRIEGDYEVEEIYLQKSGTSQLGVTLGYDTKTAKGHLYVCEILPTGLAYQDGRLKCGDIIRRVNGFEVYDPEEAILLFLEQDQDITLTVARKIKPVSNRLILTNDATNLQPAVEHTYAVLEEKAGGSNTLRRIDSCGTLDSRSHKYAKGSNKAAQLEDSTVHAQNSPMTASRIKINEAGYEYMQGPSNPQLQESPHQLSVTNATRSTSRSPPCNFSPLCYSTSMSALNRSVSPQSPHSKGPHCTRPIHRTPSPIRHTPSPEALCSQARVASHEHLASSPTTLPPLPLSQDNKCQITRRNYEPHKIMSPTMCPQGIRKAKSFRTINEVNTCKLATRCDSNEFMFHRSESLV